MVVGLASDGVKVVDSDGLVENGFSHGFLIETGFGKDNPEAGEFSRAAVHLDECLMCLQDLVGD